MNPICDRIRQWQGGTSGEQAFEFCEEICQMYLAADRELRAEVRAAVAANETVRQSLLYSTLQEVGSGPFLAEVARRADSEGQPVRYLRAALLAVSLTDGFPDSRDTLMWLADLWREMQAHGVDPAPHYQQIGEISSDEPLHMIGGPTSLMILSMLDEHRRDQLRWK